ncbi:putative alpha/beta hydrolase [Bradyrhizobium diazoefficiens]
MRERYNTLPLAYIGHSFGGQALGLIANNTDISRAAFVASQAATWRLMTSPEKYRVFAFMNLIGVPLAHAFGYAPGWAGIGEDLPKGVFLQWADWVSSPRYLFDSKLPALENFANSRASCARCASPTIPGRRGPRSSCSQADSRRSSRRC